MNMPVEIRVTGLDHQRDVGVDGAQPALLSALAPRADHPAWDVAVWLDILSFPGTPAADRAYRDIERWAFATYRPPFAMVRPEWSKGWAYTARGAWTNRTMLARTVPAAFESAGNRRRLGCRGRDARTARPAPGLHEPAAALAAAPSLRRCRASAGVREPLRVDGRARAGGLGAGAGRGRDDLDAEGCRARRTARAGGRSGLRERPRRSSSTAQGTSPAEVQGYGVERRAGAALVGAAVGDHGGVAREASGCTRRGPRSATASPPAELGKGRLRSATSRSTLPRASRAPRQRCRRRDDPPGRAVADAQPRPQFVACGRSRSRPPRATRGTLPACAASAPRTCRVTATRGLRPTPAQEHTHAGPARRRGDEASEGAAPDRQRSRGAVHARACELAAAAGFEEQAVEARRWRPPAAARSEGRCGPADSRAQLAPAAGVELDTMLLRRIALVLVLACAGVATFAPVAPAGRAALGRAPDPVGVAPLRRPAADRRRHER